MKWSFLLLFVFSGCASTGGPIPNFESVVIKRASYDFNCPEKNIKTIQFKIMEFGAKGCGKQQNYKVRCDAIGPCNANPIN